MANKFEPAREDGLKPYDVEVWDWGRKSVKKVFATTASEARKKIVLGRYARVTSVKRTPAVES